MALAILIVVSVSAIGQAQKERRRLITWGVIYIAIALVCLIPVLLSFPKLFYFGPILLVLLMVNLWHVKQKSERAVLNDLCAVLIFSIGGAAAYWLGGGGWDRTMLLVVVFNVLFHGQRILCEVGIPRANQ